MVVAGGAGGAATVGGGGTVVVVDGMSVERAGLGSVVAVGEVVAALAAARAGAAARGGGGAVRCDEEPHPAISRTAAAPATHVAARRR
jgi:hypothetical protein